MQWRLACCYINLGGRRNITKRWLKEYNTIRPHEALQGLLPRQFALQNA
ncbi:MAG: integrase core domain-containing protein [Anaerolineales bacterium]